VKIVSCKAIEFSKEGRVTRKGLLARSHAKLTIRHSAISFIRIATDEPTLNNQHLYIIYDLYIFISFEPVHGLLAGIAKCVSEPFALSIGDQV